jgi:hypothetical protein
MSIECNKKITNVAWNNYWNHVAWNNYWNGWNDCCDARGKPWWKRIFDRTPPDGGLNRPRDPEKQKEWQR